MIVSGTPGATRPAARRATFSKAVYAITNPPTETAGMRGVRAKNLIGESQVSNTLKPKKKSYPSSRGSG
jgi:hypothetical protein